MWRQGPAGIAHGLWTLTSEIDAATAFFPVAVARRVEALAPAYFSRPLLVGGPGIIRVGFSRFSLIFWVTVGHGESMPEGRGGCSIRKATGANGNTFDN